KTAMGGILLGIIGLSFPQIFGVGYGAMNIADLGNMEIWLLFALIFLKILASSITLGSGSSGGIFAPSLFMGAMTGGFFGNILSKLWPGMTAGPGAYALVAMSAVVAATTHAPITAILIIFEMTNDYKIILPLMIATIISLVVTKAGKGSIYTLKLLRKGINIHQGREINILKSMRVEDVMRKSIEIICPRTSINELSNKFVLSDHNFFYIVDEDNIITDKISQTELAAIAPDYEHLKDIVVSADIATPNHLVVSENDHLDYVMKEFAKENIGEIPVISSKDPSEILGTIWRIDVISAYNKEILKRDLAGEVSHLMTASSSKLPVEVAEGLYLLELEVPIKFKGKKINELNIRNKYQVDVVLVKNISGSKEMITKIPVGDYIFADDDIILILGEKKKIEFVNK
ncbi:MAG: chloride channel protein, partial [Candidatus Aminicenantes bacterium]|nr:chloride channel protein [Candidatus Aminicenantes bacterium]